VSDECIVQRPYPFVIDNSARPSASLERMLRLLAARGPDDFAQLHVTAHQARVLITHIEWLESQLANRSEAPNGQSERQS
jgi:asparagine synthetase B (glutamine-hydrolysing)